MKAGVTVVLVEGSTGGIISRVVARLAPPDRAPGSAAHRVDELSYGWHHQYVTTVVDHVKRRVVWAAEGKSAKTVDAFLGALGPERVALIETVTMDMSAAYIDAVTRGAPNARIVFDRFHVQRMAQDAVDKVRRDQVRLLGGPKAAGALKKSRWALLKNPLAPRRRRAREARRHPAQQPAALPRLPAQGVAGGDPRSAAGPRRARQTPRLV